MRWRMDHAKLYNTRTEKFDVGSILWDEEKILYRGNCMPPADVVIDAQGVFVTPGMVDVHTHGRAGFDFGNADAAGMDRLAESYFRSGVTALFPTLASDTPAGLAAAADRIRAHERRPGMARFAGVHLEGRYLNPAKRGAHAAKLLNELDAAELKNLLPHLGHPCHITAALELDRDGSFARTALEAGATLALGHTSATEAEAQTALANGATAFTHLFNAMPTLHHRDGGAVCTGLCSDAFVELICDGMHICPGMIRLAYRAHNPEKFVLVTDSMEATGMPDGDYAIAGLPVVVKDGRAVTLEGALAGSTLSLERAVCNLMDFCGLPFEKAIYHATMAPAAEVGIEDRYGSLDKGKVPDLLLWKMTDGKPCLQSVLSGGYRYDL